MPDVEAIPSQTQNDTARVDVQVAPEKRPLSPLFWSRITSLFFAFAFLVVAGSLGAFCSFYIDFINFIFFRRLYSFHEVSQCRKSTRCSAALRNSGHHKHRKFVYSHHLSLFSSTNAFPPNRPPSNKRPPHHRLLPHRLPHGPIHVRLLHPPAKPPRRFPRPHDHAHGVHAPVVSRHYRADGDLGDARGADLCDGTGWHGYCAACG